ncbi:Scd6-like Sm domain-domain-containing protein [Tuber borchii]|uniref:Scd6-like Sm domain-domain-containing protein n=1 Tax=Tuber borchii TaxID=42251 RepID=A0A2T6ZZJ7_TUBBO|nr:Scd6-like Sm domain-domain-containing protein [Tuber borchii]
MSEFIGYVGRLHDINSENHTVALEQVVSHGTEGRRGDPAKEIAGSDNVYEYIVFRGGDVKDLRIEETAPQPPQPQVPDDPAILGSSTRPPPPSYAQGNQQPPNQYQQQMPPYYYPPPQAQGRYGSSPYQQGAMYGAYPPPQGPQQSGLGQPPTGVPQAQQQPTQQHQQSQASQQQGQTQAPQQVPLAQTPAYGPQNRAPPQAPIGPANRQQQPMNRGPMHQGPNAQNSVAQSQPPAHTKINERQVPPPSVQQTANNSSKPPTPPVDNETKPAPPAPVTQNTGRAPTGPKAHGGIVPALPLPPHSRSPRSPAPGSSQPVTRNAQSTEASASSSSTHNDTNAAVQDLANKVNQLAMKTAVPTSNVAGPVPALNDTNGGPSGEPRPARGPGTGGFVARGGRGYRGSFQNNHPRKVEVPSTDYDFASANAKFNKQDLVKEVIAGGEGERVAHPETPANGTNGYADGNSKDEVVIPPAKFYNRGSSFFDNISCENKERAEAKEGEKPRGGAVWRGEEQKKNLETFGQGSVDGGFNHYGRGWRGRGRGRGGYRGRGLGYSGSYSRSYRGQSQGQRQQQDGGAAAGDGDDN